MGTAALPLDQVADCVAVICPVGEHDSVRRKIVEQDICGTAVGDVTAGQQEAERAAFAVGKCVELAVATASADPDRLDERPLMDGPHLNRTVVFSRQRVV